jgi:hypothetical protein
MYTIKAHVTVEVNDITVFKKNVVRTYDGPEPTITAKIITDLYKQLAKEFYDRYSKKREQVSVAVKIFYISGKPNDDT